MNWREGNGTVTVISEKKITHEKPVIIQKKCLHIYNIVNQLLTAGCNNVY